MRIYLFCLTILLCEVGQTRADLLSASNSSDLFVRTSDNCQECIASELLEAPVRRAVAKFSRVLEDVLENLQFETKTRDDLEGGGRTITLRYDPLHVKAEDVRAVMGAVEFYVDNRCLGHTADFAIEMLLAVNGDQPISHQMKRIVEEYPKAPIHRLKVLPKGLDASLDEGEVFGYVDGDFLWYYRITETAVYDGRVPLLNIESVRKSILRKIEKLEE